MKTKKSKSIVTAKKSVDPVKCDLNSICNQLLEFQQREARFSHNKGIGESLPSYHYVKNTVEIPKSTYKLNYVKVPVFSKNVLSSIANKFSLIVGEDISSIEKLEETKKKSKNKKGVK